MRSGFDSRGIRTRGCRPERAVRTCDYWTAFSRVVSMVRMTISRVLLVLAMVAVTGCSVAFQNAPPTITSRDQATTCSPSRALPWVDAGIAAAGAVGAGVGFAISQDDGGGRDHESTGAMITGAALGVAILYLASSMNGFERASTCRSAKSTTATASR